MFKLHFLVIAENVESITNHDNACLLSFHPIFLPSNCHNFWLPFVSLLHFFSCWEIISPSWSNQSAGGIMPTASGLAFSQRCSFYITFTPFLFLKQIKKYSWAITLPLLSFICLVLLFVVFPYCVVF